MSSFQDILTPEKLTDIVKSVEKTDDVELVSRSFGSTTNKGENWNSSLVAVDVVAKVGGLEKEYHWVGKFPPENQERQMFQKATMMADKEVAFYAEFAPDLKNFLNGLGLDQELKLAIPDCPYAETNPDCVYFLLNNLKKAGFSEEFDKQQGLDAAHTELALDELAKYHAVSHAYIMHKAKDSSLRQVLKDYEVITRDYLNVEPTEFGIQVLKSLTNPAVKNVLKNLKVLEESGDEDLVGIFQRFLDKHDGRHHLSGRKVNLNEFNAVIHNDYWFNNMLFRYEKGQDGAMVPREISIVDFATGCWGNPAIDLSYILVMSLTPEFRKEKEDHFLRFYHYKLIGYLEKLGIGPDVYTLEQLRQDYQDRFIVGLLFFLSFPFTWIPKTKGMDQSDMDGEWRDPEKLIDMMGDVFVQILEHDPSIRSRMKVNFMTGVENGLFD